MVPEFSENEFIGEFVFRDLFSLSSETREIRNLYTVVGDEITSFSVCSELL